MGKDQGVRARSVLRALPCRELGIKVARSRTIAKIVFLRLPIDACLDLLLSNLERASVSCIPSLSQSWTPDLQHLLESKPPRRWPLLERLCSSINHHLWEFDIS